MMGGSQMPRGESGIIIGMLELVAAGGGRRR
jgi:hypothetical protein